MKRGQRNGSPVTSVEMSANTLIAEVASANGSWLVRWVDGWFYLEMILHYGGRKEGGNWSTWRKNPISSRVTYKDLSQDEI